MNINKIIREEMDDLDWMRDTKPYYGVPFMELDEIPEIGDKVICIPGFKEDMERDHNEDTYGGAGYKENRVFTVREINSHLVDKSNVVWPDDKETHHSHGIYLRALAPYEDR